MAWRAHERGRRGGQAALARHRGLQPPLAGAGVPGGERCAWVAFDLPATLRNPASLVLDDRGALHPAQAVLVGDRAPRHAPVSLALTP